jgi:hypothetical protein
VHDVELYWGLEGEEGGKRKERRRENLEGRGRRRGDGGREEEGGGGRRRRGGWMGRAVASRMAGRTEARAYQIKSFQFLLPLLKRIFCGLHKPFNELLFNP